VVRERGFFHVAFVMRMIHWCALLARPGRGGPMRVSANVVAAKIKCPRATGSRQWALPERLLASFDRTPERQQSSSASAALLPVTRRTRRPPGGTMLPDFTPAPGVGGQVLTFAPSASEGTNGKT